MGSITKLVKFMLLGVDKSASKALRGVGNETKRTSGVLGKMGGIAKGAGIIVVSTDSAGAQVLTGVAGYQEFAAVFAESAVVIYALGTDPANFERIQEVESTGTLAGRAVRSYGANDLFYLDQTGVRSLQARDSSNSAFVSDAGTAFDPFVQQVVAAASEREVQDAVSVIEPTTGAYWLAVGDKVLVLTNYPGTGIRGWTYYDLDFAVTAAIRSRRR